MGVAWGAESGQRGRGLGCHVMGAADSRAWGWLRPGRRPGARRMGPAAKRRERHHSPRGVFAAAHGVSASLFACRQGSRRKGNRTSSGVPGKSTRAWWTYVISARHAGMPTSLGARPRSRSNPPWRRGRGGAVQVWPFSQGLRRTGVGSHAQRVRKQRTPASSGAITACAARGVMRRRRPEAFASLIQRDHWKLASKPFISKLIHCFCKPLENCNTPAGGPEAPPPATAAFFQLHLAHV